MVSMDIATKQKKRLESKLEPSSEFNRGELKITLPLLTVSEANCMEHWTKKHKRHQFQKKCIYYALKRHSNDIVTPCNIKLVRLAPHKLDKHDNLPMSMKYVVDAICAVISGDFRPGKADDNEKMFSISYDQVISKQYGIIIEITWYPHLDKTLLML